MAATNYSSWSTEELVQWIVSLDDSYPLKYQDILSEEMSNRVVTGADIDDLDLADLKEYGIEDLNDRKHVYAAINELIVRRKRKESVNVEEEVLSLSDDEDEDDGKEDKLTLLAPVQQAQLNAEGYCVLEDPMKNAQIVTVVHGFVRQHGEEYIIHELIRIIVDFYSSRYNEDIYAEVICKEGDGVMTAQFTYFLTSKTNLTLCNLLTRRLETGGSNRMEIDKVSPEVMRQVLKYLGHHKGKEPAPIPKPIRSTDMRRNVEDEWDATFINAMTKKEVFQVILAANYLDIQSLLHLGSAKIACLIKGLSPDEIRAVLADDTP